ncbi:MAG: hypothetical protein ACTS82_06365 [Arsenophonus sp. ET-DL12-MAG3]
MTTNLRFAYNYNLSNGFSIPLNEKSILLSALSYSNDFLNVSTPIHIF